MMGWVNNNNGQMRIHTTIDRIDQAYCKKHNLKYAHLLRAQIRDHKLHSGEGEVAESSREMQKAKEKAIEHRNKIVNAIRKFLGPEKFDDFISNI